MYKLTLGNNLGCINYQCGFVTNPANYALQLFIMNQREFQFNLKMLQWEHMYSKTTNWFIFTGVLTVIGLLCKKYHVEQIITILGLPLGIGIEQCGIYLYKLYQLNKSFKEFDL